MECWLSVIHFVFNAEKCPKDRVMGGHVDGQLGSQHVRLKETAV
jgi:hypothetical protein